MLVVIGGLAEIAAGSISMGLGGYLAAKSLADTYHRELARDTEETHTMPAEERAEVWRARLHGGGHDSTRALPAGHLHTALALSCVVTGAALAVFGAIKGRYTGEPALRSAVQTLAIGGTAAAVAYAIGRAVSRLGV